MGSKATEQAVAPSDSSSQFANAVKTLSGRVVPTAAAAAEREPWPAREERGAGCGAVMMMAFYALHAFMACRCDGTCLLRVVVACGWLEYGGSLVSQRKLGKT